MNLFEIVTALQKSWFKISIIGQNLRHEITMYVFAYNGYVLEWILFNCTQEVNSFTESETENFYVAREESLSKSCNCGSERKVNHTIINILFMNLTDFRNGGT